MELDSQDAIILWAINKSRLLSRTRQKKRLKKLQERLLTSIKEPYALAIGFKLLGEHVKLNKAQIKAVKYFDEALNEARKNI